MIKHWRLFDNINLLQIKQLESADIVVTIEEPKTELVHDIYGVRSIKTVIQHSDVFLSTSNEKQETLLLLMFPKTLKFIGVSNERYF